MTVYRPDFQAPSDKRNEEFARDSQPPLVDIVVRFGRDERVISVHDAEAFLEKLADPSRYPLIKDEDPEENGGVVTTHVTDWDVMPKKSLAQTAAPTSAYERKVSAILMVAYFVLLAVFCAVLFRLISAGDVWGVFLLWIGAFAGIVCILILRREGA